MRLQERLREAFSGRDRLSKGQRIVLAIVIGSLVWVGGTVGYVYGFYVGTGTMPFGPQGESVIPPEITELSTQAEVEAFVEEDQTDLEQYREGFNCVEYALLAAHNAWWSGVMAAPIRIDFTDGTAHMILGFPTEDNGWMFLNPQGDLWVKLHVGGMLLDKKIEGVYYLYDLVWKPIEEAK